MRCPTIPPGSPRWRRVIEIDAHVDDVDQCAGQTHADPVEVDNALLNIVLNARDAMQGGGVLSIETRNVTLDAAVAREHNAQSGAVLHNQGAWKGHRTGTEQRLRLCEAIRRLP